MKLKTIMALAGLLVSAGVNASGVPGNLTAYIESDGSQVIDLGYPLSSDMEVELVVSAKRPSAALAGLFGARTQADERNFSVGLEMAYGLEINLDCNDETGECLTYRAANGQGTQLGEGTPYRLVVGGACRTLFAMAGSVLAQNQKPVEKSFTTAGNAYVFGINGAPSGWANAAARVHLVRIRRNGAVLHEYLPDRRNGIFGLTDVVGDGGFKTKACGNALTGLVPAAFDDYIVSDGTQVIDLGFPFTSDMAITLVVAPVEDGYEKSSGVLGARATNLTADGHAISVFFSNNAADGCVCDFIESGAKYLSGRVRAAFKKDVPTWIGLRKDEISFYVEGSPSPPQTLQPKAQTSPSFQTPCNAWLFGMNMPTRDPAAWGYAAVRFYSLTILQDGEVTHCYRPAVENGVVGIRDIAGDSGFLAPKTGDGFDPNPLQFVVGPPRVTLKPSVPLVLGPGVRPVEYIESDGTQYVDTRFELDSSISVEIDMMPTELPASGASGVVGARSGASSKNISALIGASEADLDYGNAYYSSTRLAYRPEDGYQPLARLVMELAPSCRRVKDEWGAVCKELMVGASSPLWKTGKSAWIFKVNDSTLTQTCAKMRLYRLRFLSSDGSVVRDYVPCLDPNDRPGLYDSVTGEILYQETGNDFSCGGVIGRAADVPKLRAQAAVKLEGLGSTNLPVVVKTTLTSLAGAGDVAVESDHTQCIDLGFKLSSDMVIDLLFHPLSADLSYEGYFGSRASATDRNIEVIHVTSGLLVDLNFNATEISDFRVSYVGWSPARYLAHIENGNVSLKNVDTGVTCASAKISVSEPFETVENARLFDSGAGGSFKYGKMRFYSLKVSSKDGQLLHLFVPALEPDGRIGVRDMVPTAAGGCGFRCPANSGATPLKFIPGAIATPHQLVSEFRLAEPGEKNVTFGPLKYGVQYGCVVEADNGVTRTVVSGGVVATETDVPGEGDALSVLLPTDAPKSGQLTVQLVRTASSETAANVTAYFGRTYGGVDPAKWENSAPVGTFPSGVQACAVTVDLPKDVVYVRFRTADGAWSPTVFIPETKFRPTGGFVMWVR